MQFTKWRYKNGQAVENIAEFMEDMKDGQLIQLTLNTCPLIDEGIRHDDWPNEEYFRIGGCWCDEYTRDECAAEV